MLEKIEGRRRKGQQRIKWLNGITDWMDISLSKLQEMVKDSEAWHASVYGVTKSQKQLSNWTTWTDRVQTFPRGLLKKANLILPLEPFLDGPHLKLHDQQRGNSKKFSVLGVSHQPHEQPFPCLPTEGGLKLFLSTSSKKRGFKDINLWDACEKRRLASFFPGWMSTYKAACVWAPLAYLNREEETWSKGLWVGHLWYGKICKFPLDQVDSGKHSLIWAKFLMEAKGTANPGGASTLENSGKVFYRTPMISVREHLTGGFLCAVFCPA